MAWKKSGIYSVLKSDGPNLVFVVQLSVAKKAGWKKTIDILKVENCEQTPKSPNDSDPLRRNQQSWQQKVGSQIKGSWFFWFSNFVGGFSWFASPLKWCLGETMVYAAVLCIIYAYTCIHVISIFLHAYVQTCLFAGGWPKKNRIEERDWKGTYFLKGSHGSQDFVVRNDSPCGSTIGGVWRGWYCSTMKGIRFFEDLGFGHIFRKLGMEMLKLMMCFKHNPPKKTMCSKHNPNNQIFGIWAAR